LVSQSAIYWCRPEESVELDQIIQRLQVKKTEHY